MSMKVHKPSLNKAIKEDIQFVKWRERVAESKGEALSLQYWQGAQWALSKIREEIQDGLYDWEEK